MSITDALFSLDPQTLCLLVSALLLLAHLVPYLVDTHSIRSNSITGPFLAQFSDIWLGWRAAQGHRSEVVHKLHQKYGKFVRIAPNHVSIADSSALQAVYGHGNGALKSDYYDAFFSIYLGLFNTRSRAEHTRKRKIVANTFSPKNVLEFEPQIRLHVGALIAQWDRLCIGGEKGESGLDGESGWKGRNGRVWLDCLPWYNYLAFDIIGDLAFGSPFGMVKAGKDFAPVVKSQKDAIASFGDTAGKNVAYDVVPAVRLVNDRGDYNASLGALPPWWRPLVTQLVPWYARGSKAKNEFAGIAVAAVAKRLATPTDRKDLLSMLQAGKDEDGNPMGMEELTGEAQTHFIAGSDTTANSSCAITYHLAHNPAVQAKLQKELDDAFGTDPLEDIATTYEQVKHLPYLGAVINETLRIHSTSALGLPRIVPEGGITVLGKSFPEGTVLSVPTYSIHREKEIWGDDVEAFRPERWMECDKTAIQSAFNPFSYGPRACVGRNLAMMELSIIISSIMKRYHFVLEDPNKPFEVREGFLRKPLQCHVGLKRRNL